MTFVLLPDSIELTPTLPAGVHTARYDVTAALPDSLTAADALVVWGNSAEQLTDCARRMTAVRWVQTLMAGPDAVLGAGFAPSVAVTSGRGLHDAPVAEHTLALTLALARRLPAAVRAQDDHRWASELGGSQPLPGTPEAGFSSLSGAQVLIWGFGSIAQHLAPMLTQFGAQVTGVASQAGEREGFPVLTAEKVGDILPSIDVLIGILPATSATRHVLNSQVFDRLPDHAVVVNVGRGSTLDEQALLAALHGGRLAGAALDVTEVEPLPDSSPLWQAPGMLITPHAAGGRPVGASAFLTENIAAFVDGRPLRNLVNR